ncbi:MAG: TolC family protein [Desulfobacca sp.]|nr:TolC family protein [Desulfobacca sp.]
MSQSYLRLCLLSCLVLIGLVYPLRAEEMVLPPSPLSLEQALNLAWKKNPALKVSRLDQLIADQEVVRARSGYLPKVDARTSQTIYDNPTKFQGMETGGPGGAFTFSMTDRNFWSNQVTLDQTIYDFGATGSRYRQSVLGKEIARLNTGNTRDEIFFQVAQLYFQVLRSEKLVIVAQQEVVQLQEHLKDAQDLFEFGLVTYNDVLQAQVALSDARQQLIRAQNTVINTRAAFNKLLNIPVDHPTQLQAEDGIALPTWNQQNATELALGERSDLKAVQRQVLQGEKGVDEARAGYFPRLFAQAGHSYQQNDLTIHDSQYFAILGLQWNLFSGLDTRAQVAQASQRVQQLQVQKHDLDQQVRLEVQTASLGLKETAERITVTKDAVAQGEENLRLNQERYREQVGTATDVIDAQTLLTRARVNYFNAIFDHQIAKAQMLRAVGRINSLAAKDDLDANGQKNGRP